MNTCFREATRDFTVFDRQVPLQRGRFVYFGSVGPYNYLINRSEVARCTLTLSCSTDMDSCVVFLDRVGVFLEHVHGTLKASERFSANFPVVSLYFTCLLALVASIATAAKIT